jgi:lipopolysaccharide transport system permease protein
MIRNLRELYQYRALLWALTIRELKARYRASFLGFLWTFLNPTLNMLVYVLVFGVMMSNPTKRFPFFVFCGLLPWVFFSSSIMGGTTAVSDRKDLLTKVRFPAQVLPATVVMSNLVNFILSVPLLFLLGALYDDVPTWHLVFAIPLVLLQTLFTLAITYLLSALNVAFRDLQHIVVNVMQMLFFLTPVIWDLRGVPKFAGMTQAEAQRMILYANPLAGILSAWRDIFYEHAIPAWEPLAMIAGLSVVLMWTAATVFERRREEFAEII